MSEFSKNKSGYPGGCLFSYTSTEAPTLKSACSLFTSQPSCNVAPFPISLRNAACYIYYDVFAAMYLPTRTSSGIFAVHHRHIKSRDHTVSANGQISETGRTSGSLLHRPSRNPLIRGQNAAVTGRYDEEGSGILVEEEVPRC